LGAAVAPRVPPFGASGLEPAPCRTERAHFFSAPSWETAALPAGEVLRFL